MPLTREQLIDLAVERYFKACNAGDLNTAMGVFAPHCVVEFSSAAFRYEGLDAIRTHLEEFRDTFDVIDFHDFSTVVDTHSQCIAVQFEVSLSSKGDIQLMRNCNFFQCDHNGSVKHIMIYNSAPLDEGFNAGSR